MSDGEVASWPELCAQLPTLLLPKADDLWQRVRRRQQRQQPVDRLRQQLRALCESGRQSLAETLAQPWHLDYPQALPVSGVREAVISAIGQRRLLVLTGETGSGKTTQLPKMLIEAGCGRRGRIAITQPRRLAALTVAARLREECALSDQRIAHAVRFDDQSNEQTRVVVQTDGLLLAEAARDPWLSRYDAIMVDEAHERSTTIDVLLALLIQLRRRRPDLVVVITSATIDAERMSTYLGDGVEAAPLIAVPGRLFPVERRFLPPATGDLGYLDTLVNALRMVHQEQPADGDVLCFLPTERDILEARRRLADLSGATVLPCFGRLTAHEQQRIFSPCAGRKVVLATPIAETSLTIPGITVVIDSGLARLKRYAPHARTERLPVEAVAQSSLAQRAGRAGRLRPGICYQLFTEQDAASRPAYTEPEIRRSNLSGVLLQLLASGLHNPEDLPWLDPPQHGDWDQAWRALDELGAIDEQRRLTRLGRRLSHLPLDPQLARMCLAGFEEGVAHEAITLAAFLSIQDPRLRPLGEEHLADSAQAHFHHEAGDVATVIQIWDAWTALSSSAERSRWIKKHYLSWRRLREWADVRRQIARTLSQLGLVLPPSATGQQARQIAQWDALHRSLLSGMLGMVLMRDNEQRCYRGSGQRPLQIHPSSVLRARRDRGKKAQRPPWPTWLVACEVVDTGRAFARICAPIDPQWVLQLAGSRCKYRYSDPRWDRERARVVIDEQVSWLGLPIIASRQIAAEKQIGREASEAVFIEQALVPLDFHAVPSPLRSNQRIIDEVAGIACKLRDRSLQPQPAIVAAAYEARLNALERGADPRPLTSLAALKHLFRTHGNEALQLSGPALCKPWRQARQAFPDTVTLGPGLQAAVRYRHQPGDEVDGATVRVNEDDLPRIEGWRLARAIPGLVHWQVEFWSARLSSAAQGVLAPLEYRVIEWSAALLSSSGPLSTALREAWTAALGPDFALPSMPRPPEWMHLRVEVVDGQGAVRMATREWSTLGIGGGDEDPLAALRAQWQSDPAATWPGDIPTQVRGPGQTVYPALLRCRDAQAEVAVQRTVFASARAAQAWHRDGLLAFVEAANSAQIADSIQRLQPRLSAIGDVSPALMVRTAILALLDDGIEGNCQSAEQAALLVDHAQRQLENAGPRIAELLREICGEAKVLDDRLRRGGKGLAAWSAVNAIHGQRDRLLESVRWQTMSWQALQWLPDWLAVLHSLLDGHRQPSAKDQARAQRVRSDWDELMRDVDYPTARALGLAGEWKAAMAMADECWTACMAGRRPRAPASELGLRSTFQRLRGELSKVVEAWHRAAAPLRELRPLLDRCPGPLALNLSEEIDRALRRGLDVSLGADVDAQPAYLQSLGQRARRLI